MKARVRDWLGGYFAPSSNTRRRSQLLREAGLKGQLIIFCRICVTDGTYSLLVVQTYPQFSLLRSYNVIVPMHLLGTYVFVTYDVNSTGKTVSLQEK